MKGISVSYNNLLIKFLMKNDSSKYFRVLPIWPDPIYPSDLPEDTCGLFWTVIWHSLGTLKNFIWAFVFALSVGFVAYSVVTAMVLWLYFGLNPMALNDVVASIGCAVIEVTVVASLIFGGIFLYHEVRSKIKASHKQKASEQEPSKPSMVYEGAKLMGALFKAFHEKTCFKIEYIKGGENNGRN